MFCTQCGTKNDESDRFCSQCGVTLPGAAGDTMAVEPSLAPPRYAGFWFRFLAAIVDALLCQIVIVVIALLLGFALIASMTPTFSESEIMNAGSGMGFLVGILVQWLWFTVSESSRWQATLGKKMFGLRVTDEQGGRIGFGRANTRYWCKILSTLILFIGFVMVAFTKKKQGLHDKIADTLVIRRPAS
ncbi:MAG: RDD family protein [Magnetococcales bacterium]|nr:RDD family protein [Magnetococcales bacterium]